MRETSGEDSLPEPNESVESDESPAGRAHSVAIDQAFDAPWQARAFAVAVAMTREGGHSWDSFQERLATEVERDDHGYSDAGKETEVAKKDHESAYYEQWLRALTRLLIESGTLSTEEIAARAEEFADGERTAEEWVEGARDHVHGEGHAGDEHGNIHNH